MGWLILFLLAAIAFAALIRWGKLPRSALELSAAALVVALLGYAMQGSPAQPGAPVASRERQTALGPETSATIRSLTTGVGSSAQWLQFSDTLARIGQTRSAVTAIRSGLKENPNDPDLWVGLGNALIVHADGLVTPAAQYAFDRAARLDRTHPGPPFFLGLALAQQGKTAQAGEVWRALLARAPAKAAWRAELEARLAIIGESSTEPARPSAPSR